MYMDMVMCLIQVCGHVVGVTAMSLFEHQTVTHVQVSRNLIRAQRRL